MPSARYVIRAPVTLIREANAVREAGHRAEAHAAYVCILGRWPALLADLLPGAGTPADR